MFKYIVKRILLMIPTFIGITLVCFVINSVTPGGPIEQKIAQMRQAGLTGSGGAPVGSSGNSEYGISQEVVDALKKKYGFDKPVYMQYLIWLKNVFTFDFGESFIYEEPAIKVVMDRLPVSLQFGIVSLILTYLVCIILGVLAAIRKGTAFELTTSVVLLICYSIPALILGILLKVFLAGGNYLDWFPIGDLYSDTYFEKDFFGRVLDRAHHFVLPMLAYMIGSFTVLTQFMKNSLLDEIQKDYVRTAKAKGLSQKVVFYKHALRNALVPIATGFGSFIGVFLTGSLIIEKIFSINGIGLLGFTSALQRDYNVLMALVFIQAFISLIGRLISDLLYVVIDPRIDFS